MNSSIEQLREAVQYILNPNDNLFFSAGNSMECLPISKGYFHVEHGYANEQLKNAWRNVYNFLQEIHSETFNIVYEVRNDIMKYIELIESNDVALINAIEKNNVVSQDILNKLKSLSL